MQSETLEYKGYKIQIQRDEDAENPFEQWDWEPPLVTYYAGRNGYAKSYKGAPETMADLIRLMPEACFSRGQRVALFKKLGMDEKYTFREFAQAVRDYGTVQSALIELVTEQVGSKPEGWRDALAWFEMAESLLTWAGIPCLSTQSNGYCQGDCTLLLVILLPEWVKMAGTKPEHFAESMQQSADLYGAWAWGDVYGVAEILDPSGDEIEKGSCWGFYGRDHDKSGLMEHARTSIDWHLEQVAQTALNMPACLI